MLEYYVMKLVSKIFCVLPWSIGLAFGNMLGRVAPLFVPEWRMKMAAANVEECLHVSPEEARKIAHQSVVKFGRMIVEVLRFPLLNRDTIHSVVKTDGLEYLEEAYAKGKGALMCTGHFGNWELAGGLHSYITKQRMMSIMRPLENPKIGRYVYARRCRYLHRSFSKDLGVRPLIQAHKAGENVTIVSDQHGIEECLKHFIIGNSCRVIPILRHYLDLRAVVAEFVSEAVFQHDRKHRDVIFQGKRQLCIFCPVLLMNEFGRDGKHYKLHFLEDIFHFLISGSCGSDLFVIEDRAVRVV